MRKYPRQGCGGRRHRPAGTQRLLLERSDSDAGGSADAGKGFAADSLIGVALPAKTSENWVLAGDLFTNGLKDAGFQSDVQYAGASTTVADQQAQISAMVTKGAKVIVIGATDAAQLSHPGGGRQGGRRDRHRLRPADHRTPRTSTTTSRTTTSRSASSRARPCWTA